MRIDPNVPTSNSGPSEHVSDSKSTGSARSGAGVEQRGQLAGDSASISALATQLGNFPSVRQERVQAVRNAVQSGTYKVDSSQVAQSMLGDLFGTGSGS